MRSWILMALLASCGSRAAELPVRAAAPAEPDPNAPFVLADDAILPVERIEERTFVVLGRIDSREAPVGDDFDSEAVTVHPSARAVPTRFRLAGEGGECEGTNGRAVELESSSMSYSDDDDVERATTYRTSAVEVDAACDAVFATSPASHGRLEWVSPEIEREGEYGQWGPPPPGSYEMTVARPPVGVAGHLEGGWEFENHVTCDQEHTMELRAGARRARIPWDGYSFGLLHAGARTYLASLGLFGWSLHPVGEGSAPELPALPSRTSVDVDHAEMDGYTCLDPEE